MSEYRGDEYFVDDNGTLMHYGVKGMKWKNHQYKGTWINGRYVNPSDPMQSVARTAVNRSGAGHVLNTAKNNIERAAVNSVRQARFNQQRHYNRGFRGNGYYGNAQISSSSLANRSKAANQQGWDRMHKSLEDKAARNREAMARGANMSFTERANRSNVGDKRKRYANENQGFAEFVKNDIKDRAYDAKWALKRAGVNARAKARAGLYKAGRAWRNGLGGEIRRTADRFVSDTADFYRNKASKARTALRNAARGIRGGIDDTVESIANRFKKKRR